jgi:hypothetical protein
VVATCVRYDFNVTAAYPGDVRKATFKAALTWDVLLNNFDMRLVDKDDRDVIASTELPPAATASLKSDIGPGHYALIVVGQLVVAGGYTVAATFEPKA